MTGFISKNIWLLYFVLVFGNYFSNIAFSYLNIEYSLSIGFFLISIIFGVVVIGTMNKRPLNIYPVCIALIILVASFISVFIVNNIYNSFALSAGAYIAAVSPIVFYLVFQHGIAFSSIKSIKYFYKIVTIIFALNLLVSFSQYYFYETGVLSKEFFWNNSHLNAIIFPRTNSADSLRVPGLFSSGGSNAIFNFIYFVGYSTVKGVKRTFSYFIIVVSCGIVIYLALTRKVWLSIILTSSLYCLLILYFKSDQFLKILIAWLMALVLLFFTILLNNLTIFVEIEQLLKVDVLSLNSMGERISEWDYYINYFTEEFNHLELLFGRSVLQEFYHYTIIDAVLIDNVFIALFLFGGFSTTLLFFIFWLYWGVSFLKKVRLEIKQDQYLGWAGFSMIVWLFYSITSMFSTFFTSYESLMIAIICFVFSSVQTRRILYVSHD